MTHDTGPATYTVAELAERWRIKPHSVLAFIGGGHLTAINVGHVVGGRPRWRITREAVAEFEQRRAARKIERPEPRGRPAKRAEPHVIQFF